MTSVARTQAVSALKGRHRYLYDLSTPLNEVLEAAALLRDEDAVDDHAVQNKVAVELGLRSGAGSHTVQVLIGGQPRELIIDTGSGKTAFVSNTTYAECDLSKTTNFNSGEPACMSCDSGKCKYGQTYVEGDCWKAYKASDIMKLSPTFEARIEFGCIYEQSGVFTHQTSDGIMGFSRHRDSIFEQFYRNKVTHTRIFAQCLAEGGGLLTLGGVDVARHTEPVRYTPLRNTGYQYWTVHLESVSVGDATNTLEVDAKQYNAERGCVLDSGTTFLYMPQSTKGPFRQAWSRAVGSFLTVPESDTFYSMSSEQLAALPDICFWFKNDVHICLPSTRYFTQIGDGVYTGTVFFTPGPKATILGASVLESHDIIYDVDNHRVGIAKARCDLPLQAAVQLSLDLGGDTFHPGFDYSQAPQWMLAAVTLLATVGLINAIWVAAATSNNTLEDASTTSKPPAVPKDIIPNDWQGEEFAFFLMEDKEQS
ncbi:hypothetical protein BBJ29_002639 [Phytophthora kernoviae]|uniref:Peptidase A1 domain-containing protein n=1 Tax=Phytophthora kernoviae TaxID=325452 RepID=A0A3F2RNX2_9STRA|nr:hypothetical protein BBJ29_002639 [Phytophthora kernoviae]RLN61390.1 hypothetical protein BBP00_00005413 [Phytophthora kernoviae]